MRTPGLLTCPRCGSGVPPSQPKCKTCAYSFVPQEQLDAAAKREADAREARQKTTKGPEPVERNPNPSGNYGKSDPSKDPRTRRDSGISGFKLVLIVCALLALGAWILSAAGEPFHLTVGAAMLAFWGYLSLSARLSRIEAELSRIGDKLD